MKELLAAAIVAIGLGLGAPSAAHACSCAAPDPLEQLEVSPGAFIGEAIEREEDGQEAVWTFRVERSVKGDLGDRVEIRAPIAGATCGFDFLMGKRVGLFLRGSSGNWTAGLCDLVTPEQMLKAAMGLPRVESDAPIRFVVGGAFGQARLVALDRDGRIVGYGFGEGRTVQVAACPGGGRVVEYVQGRQSRPGAPILAVRDLASMEVVEEIDIRLAELNGSVLELECRSPSGDEMVLFGDRHRGPQVVMRASSGALVPVWEGRAYAGSLADDSAFICQGRRGDRAVAVDLESGEEREIAEVPHRTGPLVASPDGRWLAAVSKGRAQGPDAAPSQVVLIDLAGDASVVSTVRLARPGITSHVRWLSDGRFLVAPDSDAGEPARVFDTSLRELEQRGSAPLRDVVVAGDRVVALRANGRVVATSPGFDQKPVTLPTDRAYAIAWVADGPQVEPDVAGVPGPVLDGGLALGDEGESGETAGRAVAAEPGADGPGADGRGSWVAVVAILVLGIGVVSIVAAFLTRRRRTG